MERAAAAKKGRYSVDMKGTKPLAGLLLGLKQIVT